MGMVMLATANRKDGEVLNQLDR